MAKKDITEAKIRLPATGWEKRERGSEKVGELGERVDEWVGEDE